MFVKIKTLFCIKVFLLTKEKCAHSSRWEKIPTQRDQKQLYMNARIKER